MKVAFTGRRDGLTAAQGLRIAQFLDSWQSIVPPMKANDIQAVAHNEGHGADQVFHEMAVKRRLLVEHPGKGMRPMPRNRALVEWCDVLLACPPTNHLLKKHSGTWATIIYGFKYEKQVHIYLPNGTLITERDAIPKS